MISEVQFATAIGRWDTPVREPRFTIYRNNVTAALTAALRVRFPVVAQLVGDPFFTALGQAFASHHRPATPVLIDYGVELPGFIEGFEPARVVPYLAGVARLENGWWRAYHAAEAAPLTAAQLASIPAGQWETARLTLHPSVCVMVSPFAIGSIWQAHNSGRALAHVNIRTAESLVVARPQADVDVRVITPQFHSLLASLLAGATLAGAVQQAVAADSDVDPAIFFPALLGLNIITAVST